MCAALSSRSLVLRELPLRSLSRRRHFQPEVIQQTARRLSSITSFTTRRSSHQFTFKPTFRPMSTSSITRLLSPSLPQMHRQFSSTPTAQATYNQVRRGCRKEQRARRARSPALINRPEMKGVCLKTGITKPKKPNSGERKTARVRLSNGKVITAYIPGEGHNVQQHSVVMVRGGRAQDCPGVKYHLVRGALDLGGVANRITSRSKYGTKKPKKD